MEVISRRSLRILARSLMVVSCGLTGLTACTDDARDPPDAGGPDASPDGTLPDAQVLPDTIAQHEFGPFELWASPINDYLEVGEARFPGRFDRSVNELMPFEGRLWIGYGDATYNLGTYIPIELRYFTATDDPTPLAAVVDGAGQGAEQRTQYQSGEEQIDRYRICDGVLWQAGLDSIDADERWTQENTDPPGIEGNVYVLADVTWAKYRSVPGGEHVHDVAYWDGAVYAVGSGADDRTEFEAGQIHRYLWRSTDGGATFATVRRIAHPSPGDGDTRWVHLLPIGETLFLFGYESDFQTNTAHISNATYDGSDVTAIDATNLLGVVYPFGTAPLPDGTGVAWGVDVSASPMRHVVVHVDFAGEAARLGSFAGMTVLDLYVHAATNEIVYLAREGDLYDDDRLEYQLHVLVAPVGSPGQTVDLLEHGVVAGGHAIAYWNGALFLGTPIGHVYKAAHGG